jgi:hypothetical protein
MAKMKNGDGESKGGKTPSKKEGKIGGKKGSKSDSPNVKKQGYKAGSGSAAVKQWVRKDI